MHLWPQYCYYTHMPRTKNHLNPQFIAKIHGILHEGQPDNVSPAEFVLYLLETHKEGDSYKPITRDQLSMKIKGRAHYFTEVFTKEKPGDTLPRELAVGLANLTDTDPFFWQAQSYKLSQAAGIHIDMRRDIQAIPDSRVSSVAPLGRTTNKTSTRSPT
jgi:hypothetical protein